MHRPELIEYFENSGCSAEAAEDHADAVLRIISEDGIQLTFFGEIPQTFIDLNNKQLAEHLEEALKKKRVGSTSFNEKFNALYGTDIPVTNSIRAALTALVHVLRH